MSSQSTPYSVAHHTPKVTTQSTHHHSGGLGVLEPPQQPLRQHEPGRVGRSLERRSAARHLENIIVLNADTKYNKQNGVIRFITIKNAIDTRLAFRIQRDQTTKKIRLSTAPI